MTPTTTGIRVVPASAASADDLTRVFGERGDPGTCQCQFFKIRDKDRAAVPLEEKRARLREQTNCGRADAATTSGLVAYLDGVPAGWCAVEPRTAYPRLRGMRVPWSGRDEDRDDDGVWAVTCFVTRAGFRRRGIGRALAAATVGFARDRGARAVEGYPIELQPGADDNWGELYRGTRAMFADAGYAEVSRPTPRRLVMRLELHQSALPG
jgi:GNAT superfamily N-acetyltransferase